MLNGNLRAGYSKVEKMDHKFNDRFKKIMQHFDLCFKDVADKMGVPRSFTSNWRRRRYSFRGGKEGEELGLEHRYKKMSRKMFDLFQSVLETDYGISKEKQQVAVDIEKIQE